MKIIKLGWRDFKLFFSRIIIQKQNVVMLLEFTMEYMLEFWRFIMMAMGNLQILNMWGFNFIKAVITVLKFDNSIKKM